MRLWPRRRSSIANFGIEAGHRFRAVGAPLILWEVATIARLPWEVAPHVRLQRVDSPLDAKTVSLTVLRDGRFFLPAG
jgi:hypothetical protein